VRPLEFSRLLTVLLLTAACAKEPQTVRIDGSPGVMPLINALVADFKTREPAVTVVMGTGLPSAARVDSVASGAIDIGMASHGIVVDDIVKRGLAVHEIAQTPVVFAVHSSVPLEHITRAQACDILTGRTTNWRQLGGPDLPIAAKTRPVGEVDIDVAIAGVECLRGYTPGAKVEVIERPDSMAMSLAANTGAFGMTSTTMVDQSGGKMKALALDSVAPTADNVTAGSYKLIRQSFLVTKATPPEGVTKLLSFIASADGAKIILANGAVPSAKAPAPR
jgi:phosphate transport system substrate-binding protein